MALQATPYKISLDISDTDRGVYESVKFTVARHPSETEIRLASRILAYALFYHPQLAFGRGLSDSDEAALWQIDLTGALEHWIDVGQPDAERIIKARIDARTRIRTLSLGRIVALMDEMAAKPAQKGHIKFRRQTMALMNNYIDLYADVAILEERITKKLPAMEGLRLIRERI